MYKGDISVNIHAICGVSHRKHICMFYYTAANNQTICKNQGIICDNRYLLKWFNNYDLSKKNISLSEYEDKVSSLLEICVLFIYSNASTKRKLEKNSCTSKTLK